MKGWKARGPYKKKKQADGSGSDSEDDFDEASLLAEILTEDTPRDANTAANIPTVTPYLPAPSNIDSPQNHDDTSTPIADSGSADVRLESSNSPEGDIAINLVNKASFR